MIKANELRVGNLVDHYFSDETDDSVTDRMYEYIEAKDISDDEYLSSCYPIPLTPEIFEKSGFQSKANSAFIGDGNKCLNEYISDENEIGIRFIESNVGTLYCNFRIKNKIGVQDICCEIKYLHQLQNLYFALTGEELTINL